MPSNSWPWPTRHESTPTCDPNHLHKQLDKLAFEGNKAETRTLIPSITSFMATHQLPEVIVVADAGMLSDTNLKALARAGLRFIIGQKIPDIPRVVRQ
jgi:transposase DDE domain